MLTDVNPVTRVASHQLYGAHHQIGVGQLPMNKSVSVVVLPQILTPGKMPVCWEIVLPPENFFNFYLRFFLKCQKY